MRFPGSKSEPKPIPTEAALTLKIYFELGSFRQDRFPYFGYVRWSPVALHVKPDKMADLERETFTA
jgi:hypothetical protein